MTKQAGKGRFSPTESALLKSCRQISSWIRNKGVPPKLPNYPFFPPFPPATISSFWKSVSLSPERERKKPCDITYTQNLKYDTNELTYKTERDSEKEFMAARVKGLEKEMATHSSVLAWRIPGTGEPGGLPSMGSQRVGHDWSDLAAAAAGSLR